jgi:hypothetical protein
MKQVAPPRLMASAPVLLVKNLVQSAHHYRDAMGFTFPKFWGDPPSFVILRRDGMYLMLKQADDPAHVLCYWTVSKGLGTSISGYRTRPRFTLSSSVTARRSTIPSAISRMDAESLVCRILTATTSVSGRKSPPEQRNRGDVH